MDTLFLWFVINIVKRYRILNLRFRKIAEDSSGHTSQRSLVANIRLHCDMLDRIKEVNGIFGEIIFVQSIISCLQICFLVYIFTSNGNQQSMFQLIYQATFLLAVAMQLMLYCYSGQIIKDEVGVVVHTFFYTEIFQFWQTTDFFPHDEVDIRQFCSQIILNQFLNIK